MNRTHLPAVGFICALAKGQPARWLGTTFLFRHFNVGLTAKHCVRDIAPEEALHWSFPLRDPWRNRELGQSSGIFTSWRVDEVVLHPDADLAILKRQGVPLSAQDSAWGPFGDCAPVRSLGESFHSFGFPTQGPSESRAHVPTGRLLSGTYQRFFNGEADLQPNQHQYIELSVPVPRGHSGAPVFRSDKPGEVVGLARGTDVLLGEGVYSGSFTVAYGRALQLEPFRDWLDVNAVPLTPRAETPAD